MPKDSRKVTDQRSSSRAWHETWVTSYTLVFCSGLWWVYGNVTFSNPLCSVSCRFTVFISLSWSARFLISFLQAFERTCRQIPFWNRSYSGLFTMRPKRRLRQFLALIVQRLNSGLHKLSWERFWFIWANRHCFWRLATWFYRTKTKSW